MVAHGFHPGAYSPQPFFEGICQSFKKLVILVVNDLVQFTGNFDDVRYIVRKGNRTDGNTSRKL